MARHWIVEVFVRRGALRRFEAFKRKTTELPVRVRWDRRVSAHDSRIEETERRQTPPFTWDTADFVVAEPHSDDE